MTKSQSLERGLNVMELLNSSDRPLGPREIARQMSLSPAIVQRLLNTLTEKHYVRRDAVTKRYSIGYQILGIGASLMTKDAMLLETQRELQALANQMRVDAYLAVLQDTKAIYLLCIQGPGPVSVRCDPGQVILLHCSAIGKAILASFSDEEALKLLGTEPLPAVTPHTITDPLALVASLAQTRATGYAYVVDENVPGITSVGALIGDPSGQTRSAISAAFSRHITPELSIEQVAHWVVEAAHRINSRLAVTGG
ncbi:IclR family transcriptional regulator [Cupriavidus basilensis]|uniref:IclR family transcriptional regulator n=1 Tax=Cupriavidus basilensis TaxID=68895 RepID=A0ABT6B062_9BURK|nr:IclR family transcriptional regulator [Cupriavidus basilensis]MDF3838261.1 IclR family transcriptional regulator [Cupriavidus basilensis]